LDNITYFVEHIYWTFDFPGKMGTPSLPIWEKRVILVAQEDFSSWNSTDALVRQPLAHGCAEQAIDGLSGGDECASLTRLATHRSPHQPFDRTVGISLLAALIGLIRSLQEVSCRTGAAVIEPAEKDGRLKPALACRPLGDNRTRVAPVPARAQSSRSIHVARQVSEKIRHQRTTKKRFPR
jgi:hypothetical protein